MSIEKYLGLANLDESKFCFSWNKEIKSLSREESKKSSGLKNPNHSAIQFKLVPETLQILTEFEPQDVSQAEASRLQHHLGRPEGDGQRGDHLQQRP